MELALAAKYRKQVKKLYKTAFPKNERAPFGFLMRRTENGRDSFSAVLEDGRFIGLTYTIHVGNLVYLFYLAIVEEERGKGYGTKILKLIRDSYSDCAIILSVEDTDLLTAENYDQRIRRLGFYESNGYKKLGVKITEIGVVYDLLCTDENVTKKDFLSLMKNYLGPMRFKLIYKSQIEE